MTKFSKISVLIPTRGRVARLCTLMESYEETSEFDPEASELVFRVDDDDYETVEFMRSRPYKVVYGPRNLGYQSMPQFFNELAEAARGDVFLCGNDDMVFQTPGWASLILAAANQYPDGVFNFGVSTHNEGHYPFSIVSRRLVETLGFIWDPTIFWGDMYLRDVMMDLGRAFMLPTVRIDHDWAGFKPDKVFMESDKDITGKDPSYWSGTHRTAVNEAVSRLRGLMV